MIKYFPFKILILCILLPPVLYILTIQVLEKHLETSFENALKEIYIGDSAPLLDGTLEIEQAVTRNINTFLQKKNLQTWGIRTKISVTTRQGTMLYPRAFDLDDKEAPLQQISPIETAARNYDLLNQGLVLEFDLSIAHARLLSGLILGLYILAALGTFLWFYRIGAKKSQTDTLKQEQEIAHLQDLEKAYQKELVSLNQEQKTLSAELGQVKQHFEGEKKRATVNEEEMIQEIINLEEKLEANLAHQQHQRQIIAELSDKIQQFETGKRKIRKEKIKEEDIFQKRFSTLYKQTAVHPKAVAGFAGLTAELQLKAEEVIHQLNQDPGLVPVKRKVFGKKNRETVFEVIFSYKGRLYYRLMPDTRVEVLSIGTKHTQAKDLSFLNNL
ncbi:MAG: hypothetical protein V2J08_13880 [Desulfotignum sp.]|jgi:hypothetical protein|nr:hypothetical protein [Desulfotignum sp.]